MDHRGKRVACVARNAGLTETLTCTTPARYAETPDHRLGPRERRSVYGARDVRNPELAATVVIYAMFAESNEPHSEIPEIPSVFDVENVAWNPTFSRKCVYVKHVENDPRITGSQECCDAVIANFRVTFGSRPSAKPVRPAKNPSLVARKIWSPCDA